MGIVIFGLSNCDSTKAAMRYYKDHHQIFKLHDLKLDGITEAKLGDWLKAVPLEKLLNKKSTTWRSLEAAEQAMAMGKNSAIQLMIKYTSLIKRPIIEKDGQLQTVGEIPQ